MSDDRTMVLLCVACLCGLSPLDQSCVFVHVLNERVAFIYTNMVRVYESTTKGYGVGY